MAWLTVTSEAGIAGPASYRVGDVRVVRIRAGRALLTGCSYDSGGVYAASGAPAPPALGGGAGFTASVAVLHEVGGRWLVWSNRTSTPISEKERGPCRGFQGEQR